MGIFIIGMMMGVLFLAAILLAVWEAKIISEANNVKYGAKFVLKTKSGNPFEWEKDEIQILTVKHKWVKYIDSAGRVGHISVKQLLKNYKKV